MSRNCVIYCRAGRMLPTLHWSLNQCQIGADALNMPVMAAFFETSDQDLPSRGKRHTLSRAMVFCREWEATLLCLHCKQISHNPWELASTALSLVRHGCGLFTLEGPRFDTDHRLGEVMWLKSITDIQKAYKPRTPLSGGHPPYGWRRLAKGERKGELIYHEGEQHTLRKIKGLMELGKQGTFIMNELNACPDDVPRGDKWHLSGVRNIMRRIEYD